ncbi:MAG: hypothetical protein Q9M91_08080 [Candidatus Dojkabacteria bacterium]|nr:hypothetical protein [Candidatus Dojkabacteria bacterium]MDQ7021738.1 hypothetical protein [Candidatus Dojkabacteria bacterium]
MKDCLFSNTIREFEGPAKFYSSHYEFLNKSARPEIEALRKKYQTWFKSYASLEKRPEKRNDIL